MSNKLFIKTYGCQMNVYDSVKIGALLGPHGYELSDSYHDASLVVLNTCHIREKASEKIYSELGRIKQKKDALAKKGRKMNIVVAGCVAQAEGEEIIKRAPFVDIVVGPQSYHTLPELLHQVHKGGRHAVNLEFPVESKFDFLPEEMGDQGVSAFITVQEGCSKFCHFCCVPFTRGDEYCRSVPEIYREAMHLIANGSKEITLLGQNITAFSYDFEGETWRLGKLIKHLANLKGLERIRYTTSHPIDMIDEDLIDAHRSIPQVMPYLHLPVQSGSNRILKTMNRKYDRDYYLKVIDLYREACPQIAFSSDFIVGYPGETDQDFADTMKIVQEVGYAQSYSFKYSPRPGTSASIMDNQIPEDVKDARLYELQALLRDQQAAFNKSCVGQEMEVLFDQEAKKEGQLKGKSPYLQSVIIEDTDQEMIDKIARVKITHASLNALFAEVVNDTDSQLKPDKARGARCSKTYISNEQRCQDDDGDRY